MHSLGVCHGATTITTTTTTTITTTTLPVQSPPPSFSGTHTLRSPTRVTNTVTSVSTILSPSPPSQQILLGKFGGFPKFYLLPSFSRPSRRRPWCCSLQICRICIPETPVSRDIDATEKEAAFPGVFHDPLNTAVTRLCWCLPPCETERRHTVSMDAIGERMFARPARVGSGTARSRREAGLTRGLGGMVARPQPAGL
ncbi:hypothetical protein E2C01_020947 [Portunus trituberculatus]|uniref:Uncharacterized protein n=1 Tax=Portunus trituberculatus TaxID=210409 RepID=A0A5B7E347_PORTR|nr:hypothetical protein [Portunus trituberculatus]